MSKYITLRDPITNRQSSLFFEKEHLVVSGVLPHGTYLAPETIEDAEKLINWLTKWIKQEKEEDARLQNAESIAALEEALEQQRRDEKNGLYCLHIDDAN